MCEMAEQRRHHPGDQADASRQDDEPDFRSLQMTLDQGHAAQYRPLDGLPRIKSLRWAFGNDMESGAGGLPEHTSPYARFVVL
jgi:hypothetical protein